MLVEEGGAMPENGGRMELSAKREPFKRRSGHVESKDIPAFFYDRIGHDRHGPSP
jgi:hypothetical protein